MSSTPVVLKLECDTKENQTNHVRSKLSEILKVNFKNMFPEKNNAIIEILDHSNIGSDY
jgi:hypothetical protein